MTQNQKPFAHAKKKLWRRFVIEAFTPGTIFLSEGESLWYKGKYFTIEKIITYRLENKLYYSDRADLLTINVDGKYVNLNGLELIDNYFYDHKPCGLSTFLQPERHCLSHSKKDYMRYSATDDMMEYYGVGMEDME